MSWRTLKKTRCYLVNEQKCFSIIQKIIFDCHLSCTYGLINSIKISGSRLSFPSAAKTPEIQRLSLYFPSFFVLFFTLRSPLQDAQSVSPLTLQGHKTCSLGNHDTAEVGGEREGRGCENKCVIKKSTSRAEERVGDKRETE